MEHSYLLDGSARLSQNCVYYGHSDCFDKIREHEVKPYGRRWLQKSPTSLLIEPHESTVMANALLGMSP